MFFQPLLLTLLSSIHAGDVMVPVEESLGGADYRDAHAGMYGAAAGGPSFQADLPMRLGDLLTHMQQGGQLPSSRYVPFRHCPSPFRWGTARNTVFLYPSLNTQLMLQIATICVAPLIVKP